MKVRMEGGIIYEYEKERCTVHPPITVQQTWTLTVIVAIQ